MGGINPTSRNGILLSNQGFLHGFYLDGSLPWINLTYIQLRCKKANFTYTNGINVSFGQSQNSANVRKKVSVL